MAIKLKPQGPRFKKIEIWTKMAKVSKPQGPKWQFTQKIITYLGTFLYPFIFLIKFILFFLFFSIK
ncbi:hypothetical protein Hanom_Chr12g01112181 [Helianthus anomalus]